MQKHSKDKTSRTRVPATIELFYLSKLFLLNFILFQRMAIYSCDTRTTYESERLNPTCTENITSHQLESVMKIQSNSTLQFINTQRIFLLTSKIQTQNIFSNKMKEEKATIPN